MGGDIEVGEGEGEEVVGVEVGGEKGLEVVGGGVGESGGMGDVGECLCWGFLCGKMEL